MERRRASGPSASVIEPDPNFSLCVCAEPLDLAMDVQSTILHGEGKSDRLSCLCERDPDSHHGEHEASQSTTWDMVLEPAHPVFKCTQTMKQKKRCCAVSVRNVLGHCTNLAPALFLFALCDS